MANHFAYARISTKESNKKQTFNRQKAAFITYSKDKKIKFLRIFSDDKSGKNFNRPEWKELENAVNSKDCIVFKDITRFTREAENGLNKYMDLFHKGINLVFIDNPTMNTDYIKNLLKQAEKQDLVLKTVNEFLVKLLLTVELDRAEQERITLVKRIKDGIKASKKKQGRPAGKLDKLSNELRTGIIEYLTNRNIKQVHLIKKHKITRNTLKKYIRIVQNNL